MPSERQRDSNSKDKTQESLHHRAPTTPRDQIVPDNFTVIVLRSSTVRFHSANLSSVCCVFCIHKMLAMVCDTRHEQSCESGSLPTCEN